MPLVALRHCAAASDRKKNRLFQFFRIFVQRRHDPIESPCSAKAVPF